MPEAVIVSTARTPIGRAFKGSLKDLRPDDLTATIVRTALDKIPELDPKDIDDLYLGCGLPGGESGFNMGRIVSVLLGYDHLPGATFSAVWPMAMYASGTAPFSRGSTQSTPPWAVSAVRRSPSAKTGLCVSGSESELPLAKRETVSTPAEMNTSPSPALIAWNAIRVVCTDEEQ